MLANHAYEAPLANIKMELQSLEQTQHRAARFIFNIKETVLDTEVLKMANWKSLDHLYKKRIANITYQAFYKKAPDGINSLFTRHSSLRNHRDNLKLLIQRPNTDFLRYSFSHRASILWNNLPLHLKNKPNLSSFKFALKENSDFLDKITFNGLSGTNKDTVNYVY